MHLYVYVLIYKKIVELIHSLPDAPEKTLSFMIF